MCSKAQALVAEIHKPYPKGSRQIRGQNVGSGRYRRHGRDLGNLAASVAEYAATHNMTVVPAVPGTDSDRAVLVDPAVMDLPNFLELARKLGDRALYLHAEAFSPDPGDVPAHLARRKGHVGELRVAFASAGHGLLHFWEQTAPWYQE